MMIHYGRTIQGRVVAPGGAISFSKRTVPGSNPVNVAAPVVTGVPQSSNILTCDGGSWTGQDSITFRWLRNNVPMVGENQSTLLVISPYIGDSMVCVVSAHNVHGVTSLPSNATVIIP